MAGKLFCEDHFKVGKINYIDLVGHSDEVNRYFTDPVFFFQHSEVHYSRQTCDSCGFLIKDMVILCDFIYTLRKIVGLTSYTYTCYILKLHTQNFQSGQGWLFIVIV